MRSRVSVVVATRDRRAELERTLQNLAHLRPPPPTVVVDNASSDGTPAFVRAEHPEAEMVALRENRGGAARNAGVARVRTPYVAFSDDDSWWGPDALEAAADAFDAHPRLGLLAAAVLVGDEERPDPVNALLAAGPPAGPGLPGRRVHGFLACGAIVRTAAYRQAGGFSALLFFGGEEPLLAQDLAATGWGVCHLPQILAHHHPSRARPPTRWRRGMELRNALLRTWLRRPWPLAAARTARLARAAARDPLARRALLSALAAAPAALPQRRRLPAAVEAELNTAESG